MPTYDYVCSKCRHEFEQFQSMKDESLKRCPKCRKMGLQRKIGLGAGLLFKGSGFYITDYRSDGYKKAAKSDSTTSTPVPAPSAAPAAESKKSAKKAG